MPCRSRLLPTIPMLAGVLLLPMVATGCNHGSANPIFHPRSLSRHRKRELHPCARVNPARGVLADGGLRHSRQPSPDPARKKGKSARPQRPAPPAATSPSNRPIVEASHSSSVSSGLKPNCSLSRVPSPWRSQLRGMARLPTTSST